MYNKNEYDVEYNKAKTKLVTVRLNIENDKDILDYLDTKDNKQGYIKELIRKDMNKE